MRIPRRRLNLRVPEQFADHRQSLTGCESGRRECVSQVMDANVLQARASSDTLPEGLKISEPCARFPSHDYPRVLLDGFNLFQNLDRRLTEVHDLRASL